MFASGYPPIPAQNSFDFYTKLANSPVQPGNPAYQDSLVSASNYQLQTAGQEFAAAWSWATRINGQVVVNLIAVTPAAYSTPSERLHTPRIQYVLDAIAVLFQNLQGLYLSSGLHRYKPIIQGDTTITTFCNIFVNDITRLLHCEIPNHPLDGHRHVRSMLYWLEEPTCGVAAGWRKTTSSSEAQNWATEGFVSVMAHLRADERWSDHIALVRPLDSLVTHSGSGYFYPRIAQAGQIVSDDLDSANVRSFGGYPTNEIIYFLHD